MTIALLNPKIANSGASKNHHKHKHDKSLISPSTRCAQIFIKTNKSALKCTNSGDFDCTPFSAPPYYWPFSSKKPQNQQKTWKHKEKKMTFMFPTNMIRIPLFWKSWPLQYGGAEKGVSSIWYILMERIKIRKSRKSSFFSIFMTRIT